MALAEITALQLVSPDPDLIRAFAIDVPTVGTEYDTDRVELDGWVLGRGQRAVAIDVGSGNDFVCRLMVDLPRSDVATDHAGAPASCGFRGSVLLGGLAADIDLDVHAVLHDGRTALLAKIHYRRLKLHREPPGRRIPIQDPPAAEDWPQIHLDQPADGDTLDPGGVIAGWAFSPVGIRDVAIWLNGELLGLATYGLDREDLGRDHPDWPAAPRSGFHFETPPTSALSPPAASLEVVTEDWLGRRAIVPCSVFLAAPPVTPDPAALGAAGSLDQPKPREEHDVLWEAGWFGEFIVYGWAVDPAGVDRVDVLIDDRVAATAAYGLPRADVDLLRPDYRHLGLSGRSGWLAVIPTEGFAPGEHTISAILHGGSGALPLGQTRVLRRADNIRADEDRQRRLDSLLRCPRCGHGFVRGSDGLVCEGCQLRVPVSEFGTLLFDETYAGLDWREAFTTGHLYPPLALDLIEACRDGLVLEVGAGLHASLANVIQLDAIAYPTTDVSANGEAMPFADESFDGVIACNLLEHVTSPAKVVAEMRRVCKIGGRIYADSTTVHPYHGFPHHYFNATESGLEWLMDEMGGSIGGVEPTDPRVTVRLVLESWLGSIEDDQTRQFVEETRIGDLMALLREPTRDPERFAALDDLSPLGRRLIPPKVMFSGKRVR